MVQTPGDWRRAGVIFCTDLQVLYTLGRTENPRKHWGSAPDTLALVQGPAQPTTGPIGFYLRIARHLPGAVMTAGGWFATLLLLVLGVVFLFNQPLAEAASSWHGFSPWWAVAPFVTLFVLALMRANYNEVVRLEAAAYARARTELAPPPLIAWLDDREREIRVLQRQLADVPHACLETYDGVRAIQDGLANISDVVSAKLRLAAPQCLEEFETNPRWFHPEVIRTDPEDREPVNRLLDHTAHQLYRIRESLR